MLTSLLLFLGIKWEAQDGQSWAEVPAHLAGVTLDVMRSRTAQ